MPAFKGYRGFPGSICASPNSMVVHGIPGPYELQRGDVLSIDVGRRQGRLGRRRGDDGADRPGHPRRRRKLLDVTQASLFAGVEQMRPGNHLGDVSAAIQRVGRGRGPLDHPHPGRPRDRPRDARRPAGAELRRGRARARCSRRARCWRSSRWSTPAARWSRWATTAGPSTRRTARWPPTSSSRSRSPPTARGSSPPGTRQD